MKYGELLFVLGIHAKQGIEEDMPICFSVVDTDKDLHFKGVINEGDKLRVIIGEDKEN